LLQLPSLLRMLGKLEIQRTKLRPLKAYQGLTSR
jgi:hypothetical protein